MTDPDDTLEIEGISDEILNGALDGFKAMAARKGVSAVERASYETFIYVVMFLRNDHKRLNKIEKDMKVLKSRNIVTWVISHPRVSGFVLCLLAYDLFTRYEPTIKHFLGLTP